VQTAAPGRHLYYSINYNIVINPKYHICDTDINHFRKNKNVYGSLFYFLFKLKVALLSYRMEWRNTYRTDNLLEQKVVHKKFGTVSLTNKI
jgi:hypothetical protein